MDVFEEKLLCKVAYGSCITLATAYMIAYTPVTLNPTLCFMSSKHVVCSNSFSFQ